MGLPGGPRSGMALMVPNGELAIVELRKLEDDCLSDTHPRGRHKARVFRAALGIGQQDAAWPRGILLAAARTGEAEPVSTDAWGEQWRLDLAITRQGRRAVVRTIWMIRTCEIAPRFVSGWVLE